MVLMHSISCNRIILARSTTHKRKQAHVHNPRMTKQSKAVQKFFFLENTLSPPKLVRLAEKTPQKKIRFDSSNIRHRNRVFVLSLKSGDSPNLNK